MPYKYILPVICNYRKYILYCLKQKLYALNAHNSAHCTVYAQLYFLLLLHEGKFSKKGRKSMGWVTH